MEPNVCLLLVLSVGVKTEHARLNHIKYAENVSCHGDIFELVTSLPTQFGHISIWIPLSAMRLPTQRYHYDMSKSKSKSKSHYDRQSVGQSVLESDAQRGPAA
jgi:hypothetical protein